MVGHRVVGQILEARVLAEERGPHGTQGAVTLLGDDDFRGAPVGRVGSVHLVAVDEHDQVGVLLDAAGLTQVAHPGPLVVALLDPAIEL